MPQAKKKAKKVVAASSDDLAPDDPLEVTMEDVEELGEAAGEPGEASALGFGIAGAVHKEKGEPVSKFKFQATDADIKDKMPEACQPPYIKLRQDRLFKSEFQATYHHLLESAIIALPSDKVDSLPPQYKACTRTVKYGHKATQRQEDVALEQCLRWAWGKHQHFWGPQATRPDWTIVVADLDD
jgi:hypothetical protein